MSNYMFCVIGDAYDTLEAKVVLIEKWLSMYLFSSSVCLE